jgi:iron-sulfur cluster repair protein YtfE (RIC family)
MRVEGWETQVREDHQQLEAQVGVLKAMLEIEVGAEDRRVTLSRFIRVVGPDLELHLRKEEEVLFPALQRLAGEEAGAISLLNEQHRELRAALKRLAQLGCGCGYHEPFDWEKVAQAGQRFVDLLEDHEKKEEQLLIRVLGKALKPQELMTLARQFRTIDWRFRAEGL